MPMTKFTYIFLCVLLSGLFGACYYPQSDYADAWDLTDERRDSMDFEARHHYTENFNFLVTGDTLFLQEKRPSLCLPTGGDTLGVSVVEDDRLVVADILIVPQDTVDSVWVKVARDQLTMGWVHETDLLANVIPDDSISYFIHVFSNSHLIYFLSALGVLSVLYIVRRMRRKRFRMVHFDDIGSCYPTLLCLTLSGAATLYASMQKFVPETWVEFYYHPTLNPFGLPFCLGLFIASVWLIVLLAIAVADDVRRQLPFREALLYLFALAGMCAGCYLFFSLTTLYYIGYPCLLGYVVWALRRYYTLSRCEYLCGKCGAKMRRKGRCPRCGVMNE